ncbi:MAG: ABC transporter permease [Synechococcales bacterium]|nr:ABC transporter permease [Synechococcales bacterium]
MALSPLDLMLVTLKDLRGNLVRSGLTMLGIFMGVAAVNATLNIDAITTAQIQQKLNERDNPYVSPWIYDPSWEKDPPKLDDEELLLIQREIPGIQSFSTVNEVYGISNVQYQGQVAEQFSLYGVSQGYQQVTGRKLLEGRFFDPLDFDQYHAVAVIDEVMMQQLFQGESPINRGIYVRGIRFTVIGVSETKKTWAEQEPSGEIWITDNYATTLSYTFNQRRSQFSLQKLDDYKAVEEALEAFLTQRYPGFEVWISSNADDLYKEEQQQRASARVLNLVGLLSLVIGGVGIANITVAAVVERTREIGLRRAIGATDLEVMLQFITEAAILSLVGGLLAVVTVHFLTQTATTRVFEAPYEFRPRDATISMGAAFAVGVGASFLPALRVTRIDIVQALRGE